MRKSTCATCLLVCVLNSIVLIWAVHDLVMAACTNRVSKVQHVMPYQADFLHQNRLPGSVDELLQNYDDTSAIPIHQMFMAMQAQNCSTAKYLVVDDITTVSGFGWATLSLVPLALHALVTQRVLVHASTFIEGVHWAWCRDPPFSPECYFARWTPCVDFLRGKNVTLSQFQAMPSWDGNSQPPATFIAHKNVHSGLSETLIQESKSRNGPFDWIEPKFSSQSLKASRFWWYGAFMKYYFAPTVDMQFRVERFLLQHGVKPSDNFVVMHVRHGSKGSEQKLIHPEAYVAPLQKLLQCQKTRHVFLVTETYAVVAQMTNISATYDFHVFTVDYTYPGRDVWNPNFQKPADAGLLKSITDASALVLSVTARGSAFIGTLHSAWAKISIAHMYGYRGRPVPAISLAPGFTVGNGYKGVDANMWSFDQNVPWPCKG